MRAAAAAQGRCQRAAEGAADRQLVRRLSRRRRARAHHRRRAEEGPAHQADVDGRRTIRSSASASSAPSRKCCDELGPGEVGFFTAAIKEVADTRVGDTVTDEKHPTARGAARLQAGAAGGVLRPLPGRCRATSRICARRWAGCASTTRASPFEMETLGRAGLRLPLRLPRAACTSRSSPSGSSASSTSTSSPPRRASIYHLYMTDGTMIEMHNPADMPDVVKHRPHRGAVDQGDDPGARRVSRRRPEAVPGPARAAEGADLCRQPRAWWSTSCR